MPKGYYWYADYSGVNYGPQFCFATSNLKLLSTPNVINGVSFTSLVKWQLIQTFTVNPAMSSYVGEPLPGAPPTDVYGSSSPYYGDFTPFYNDDYFPSSFIPTTSVDSSSHTLTATSETKSYIVSATIQCDGIQTLYYAGSIGNDDTYDYRFGFPSATSTVVYAGCLATQFCF